MKTVAIIQARLGSTRFPGKLLMNLGNMNVLEWVIRAAKSARNIDEVVVATSDQDVDQKLVKFCKEKGVSYFCGDHLDVLSRYYHAAKEFRADQVVRLTADCPLLDPALISEMILLREKTKSDYVTNSAIATWPDGLDVEVMTMEALKKSFESATLPSHREHVTQFIRSHRSEFKVLNHSCPIPGLGEVRLTVDYPEDLAVIEELVKGLSPDRPPHYTELVNELDRHPHLRDMNKHIVNNEGLRISELQNKKSAHVRSFAKSKSTFEKTEKIIPLGSQTFSKSVTQYPIGYAPLYVTHGLGARIWDVDGNEYVDLVNSLLANVLGYADPDIDFAIKNRLGSGISLSLSTELEYQLAHKLTEIIPSAESVKFGKNGTDATSAAIRLARAFTKRDHVLVCGYHGWQDWYIGSTSMHRGVPEVVRQLTEIVPYNDLQALEEKLKTHPDKYACMIMEPMNFVEPAPGYLAGVKNLLHKYGVLLVFDEVITGFRFALGGAQQYFGVTPDLSCFGKAMGNGMPISALVGRKDILNLCSDVFLSSTFGGETLSIAASLAVIDKIERENVIEKLWNTGNQISTAINTICAELGFSSTVTVKGKSPWTLLEYKAYESVPSDALKAFVLYELRKLGVLSLGTNNICFAHGPNELVDIASGYKTAFTNLKEALAEPDFVSKVQPLMLKPLFKVR